MKIVSALVIAAVILGFAPPATAADVTHTGKYWSWAGPKSWKDAQGTYGITIFGDDKATLDLGFSTTVCASGKNWNESVKNYFKSQRNGLRKRGATLVSVSAIANLSATYRRQKVVFTAGAKARQIKGIAIFDYDFTTNVNGVNYCYQRSEARSSKKSTWGSMSGKLAKVSASLAYFGPGAYEDQQ